MSIDIFGRQLVVREKTRSVGSRGPPGVGFKTTAGNHYDIDNKRLCNIADSLMEHDAVSQKVLNKCVQQAVESLQNVVKDAIHAIDVKIANNYKEIRGVLTPMPDGMKQLRTELGIMGETIFDMQMAIIDLKSGK